MICRRCLRALPARQQKAFKTWWRRERWLARSSTAGRFAGRLVQFVRIETLHRNAGDRIWNAIRGFFRPQTRPAGIDAFLEEMFGA